MSSPTGSNSRRDRVVTAGEIVYQAPGRVYPEDRYGRGKELVALLGEAARYLRGFAQSQREYDDATDVIKGKRLSYRCMDTLVSLAARADRPQALEDALCHAVLGRMAVSPLPCRFTASYGEQQRNAPLDDAQLIAHHEDTPTRWLQVAELASEQERASKILKESALFAARRTS